MASKTHPKLAAMYAAHTENAHELFLDLDFEPIDDHDFGGRVSPRQAEWFAARYAYVVEIPDGLLVAHLVDDDGVCDLIRFTPNGVELDRARFNGNDSPEGPMLTAATASAVRAVAMAWGNK